MKRIALVASALIWTTAAPQAQQPNGNLSMDTIENVMVRTAWEEYHFCAGSRYLYRALPIPSQPDRRLREASGTWRVGRTLAGQQYIFVTQSSNYEQLTSIMNINGNLYYASHNKISGGGHASAIQRIGRASCVKTTAR